MPTGSLAELQRHFIAALLAQPGAGAGALPLRDAGAADGEARLAIYRANARHNFADALAAAFPLLQACMADGEFRKMAWAYQRSCPPAAGNVLYNGARLAEFLAGHLTGTPDEGLLAIARLEWAIQEALVAADDPELLDLSVLAAVDPASYAALRFRLHPAVRLVATSHPVFAAWQALQQGGRPELPATGEGERLMVRRRDDGIEVQRLAPAAFAALTVINKGSPLAVLLDEVQAVDGQAEPGAVLQAVAALGVLTGFTVSDDAA